MPSYWFVLMRHFLRIDDVLVRAYETRMFHLLDTDYVLREFSTKEAKASDLNVSEVYICYKFYIILEEAHLRFIRVHP